MSIERKVHEAAGKARNEGFSEKQIQTLVGLMEAVFSYQAEKYWGEKAQRRKASI